MFAPATLRAVEIPAAWKIDAAKAAVVVAGQRRVA
jgi:hypothetical protein